MVTKMFMNEDGEMGELSHWYRQSPPSVLLLRVKMGEMLDGAWG